MTIREYPDTRNPQSEPLQALSIRQAGLLFV
jgi:hypothetical protein